MGSKRPLAVRIRCPSCTTVEEAPCVSEAKRKVDVVIAKAVRLEGIGYISWS